MTLSIKNSDEMVILPYPFPISDLKPAPLHNPQYVEKTSLKSSMRRLRTETPSMSGPRYTIETFQLAIETLSSNVEMAFREGRYQEALQYIENFETVWNEAMLAQFIDYVQREFPTPSFHIKPAIELLSNAALKEGKSYFLALLKNPDALPISEEGFKQLNQGLAEAIAFMKETGLARGFNDEEIQYAQEILQAIHHFFRAHIELSLGMKREAVADLKAVYAFYEKMMEKDDLEFVFLLKTLEQKLGTRILPIPAAVDLTNPQSLFCAGRYEEALVLMQTSDDVEGKALCLAMLGRYEEALGCYPNKPSVSRAQVYFLQGDLEAAKREALESEGNFTGALLLLLAMRSFEED